MQQDKSDKSNIIKDKPTKNLGRKRSLTRLVAIQILYQYNFFNTQNVSGKKSIADVTNEIIDNYILDQEEVPSSYRQKIDIDFLTNLTTAIIPFLNEIDQDIAQLLQKTWTLAKLPDVALEIIRIAVFELRFMVDVPVKVVINEYVDIASSFYDDKKVTFVNSILDNLAKKYRPEEFGAKESKSKKALVKEPKTL
jgi:N utilization substance protein B